MIPMTPIVWVSRFYMEEIFLTKDFSYESGGFAGSLKIEIKSEISYKSKSK